MLPVDMEAPERGHRMIEQFPRSGYAAGNSLGRGGGHPCSEKELWWPSRQRCPIGALVVETTLASDGREGEGQHLSQVVPQPLSVVALDQPGG